VAANRQARETDEPAVGCCRKTHPKGVLAYLTEVFPHIA